MLSLFDVHSWAHLQPAQVRIFVLMWIPHPAHSYWSQVAGRKTGIPSMALMRASSCLAFLRNRLRLSILNFSAGELSGLRSEEALARGTGPWSLAWIADELLDPGNMSLVSRAKWLRLTNAKRVHSS